MTNSQVEAGHARILILAMEHDFPAKMTEWTEHLRAGRMTPEMREVFVAMGYPVPRHKAEKRVRGAEPVSPERVEAQEREALDGMHASDGGSGFTRFAPMHTGVNEPVSDEDEGPEQGIFPDDRTIPVVRP